MTAKAETPGNVPTTYIGTADLEWLDYTDWQDDPVVTSQDYQSQQTPPEDPSQIVDD